jgi:hypothetical protein
MIASEDRRRHSMQSFRPRKPAAITFRIGEKLDVMVFTALPVRRRAD